MVVEKVWDGRKKQNFAFFSKTFGFSRIFFSTTYVPLGAPYNFHHLCPFRGSIQVTFTNIVLFRLVQLNFACRVKKYMIGYFNCPFHSYSLQIKPFNYVTSVFKARLQELCSCCAFIYVQAKPFCLLQSLATNHYTL